MKPDLENEMTFIEKSKGNKNEKSTHDSRNGRPFCFFRIFRDERTVSLRCVAAISSHDTASLHTLMKLVNILSLLAINSTIFHCVEGFHWFVLRRSCRLEKI